MMQQRTEEWYQARLGKVTASRIADIVAKTQKGAYTQKRVDYMNELLCERLTGQREEKYTSSDMQRGTELEEQARQMYELESARDVSEIAFVPHPRIQMNGASPDGLIEEEGLLEIKCPKTATHLAFLENKQPKFKYICQMQWQMACTGRKWCDFVSYDDRLPENLAYRSVHIPRDDDFIQSLEQEVEKFLAELEQKITHIQENLN